MTEGPLPISLPLSLVVIFEGWSRDGADIRLSVREPGGHTVIGIKYSGDNVFSHLHLTKQADGACHLSYFGGEVAFRPGADASTAVATQVRPFAVTPS